MLAWLFSWVSLTGSLKVCFPGFGVTLKNVLKLAWLKWIGLFASSWALALVADATAPHFLEFVCSVVSSWSTLDSRVAFYCSKLSRACLSPSWLSTQPLLSSFSLLRRSFSSVRYWTLLSSYLSRNSEFSSCWVLPGKEWFGYFILAMANAWRCSCSLASIFSWSNSILCWWSISRVLRCSYWTLSLCLIASSSCCLLATHRASFSSCRVS